MNSRFRENIRNASNSHLSVLVDRPDRLPGAASSSRSLLLPQSAPLFWQKDRPRQSHILEDAEMLPSLAEPALVVPKTRTWTDSRCNMHGRHRELERTPIVMGTVYMKPPSPVRLHEYLPSTPSYSPAFTTSSTRRGLFGNINNSPSLTNPHLPTAHRKCTAQPFPLSFQPPSRTARLSRRGEHRHAGLSGWMPRMSPKHKKFQHFMHL